LFFLINGLYCLFTSIYLYAELCFLLFNLCFTLLNAFFQAAKLHIIYNIHYIFRKKDTLYAEKYAPRIGFCLANRQRIVSSDKFLLICRKVLHVFS